MTAVRALRSSAVLVEDSLRPATLLLESGRIAAVLPWSNPPASVPLEDLGDLALLPGLVDVHVHMNEPGNTAWEGAATATRAAAAGGITTVVDMPLNSIPVTTSVRALEEKRAALGGKCTVDVGFHGGLVAGNAGDIEALLREGVLGIKAFLCDSGLPEFAAAREEDLRQAMPILRRYGVPLLAHAEVVSGPPPRWSNPRSPAEWTQSRPVQFELDAIAMLARAWHGDGAGCPVHVVHISSAVVADAIRRSWPVGAPVTLETCPHYLFFTLEQIPEGDTRYKCAPPIRPATERDALWSDVVGGEWIVGSDHSPCPPELKRLDTGDFSRAWGGIASLQLGLPVLHTLARERGGPGLAELAAMMSTRPARMAGLAGRKGALAPGYDADVIAFDRDASWRVEGARLEHRHKVTPYEGAALHGRVVRTWLRGVEVFRDGDFPSPPAGQFLRRSTP